VNQINQNLDNEYSDEWKVDVEVPSERKPQDGREVDLGSGYKTNKIPTTERNLVEQEEPIANSGHSKNKLSIIGNPKKMPYQAGFIHPSMAHTDDMTSMYDETYQNNLLSVQTAQLEKLQLQMSEKLKSGGILNPLDSNKPRRMNSKMQGSKREISIFHVDSRTNSENQKPILDT
jgi:hypothetical protein